MSNQTETPKRYRYSGKERDEETGFYYQEARYYAPWLGRWTSCDPTELKDGVDLYVYVRSNPIGLIDPTGTDSRTPNIAQMERRLKEIDAEIAKEKELLALYDKRDRALSNLKEIEERAKKHRMDTINAKARIQVNLEEINYMIKENEAEYKWNMEHGIVNKLYTSYEEEKDRARARMEMEKRHQGEEVPPNLLLDMTDPILRETPAVSSKLWLLYAGGLGTARPGAPGSSAPKQLGPGPGPGTFGAEDVAFGLARAEGQAGALVKFAGKAVPGTRAPLSEMTRSLAGKPGYYMAIAKDTLKYARELIQQTGGRLRFSLKGFNPKEALTPGTKNYSSITSEELRGILKDPFLRSRTSFYDAGGIDVTSEILQLGGK
jgi:RHS repeat-associated protein